MVDIPSAAAVFTIKKLVAIVIANCYTSYRHDYRYIIVAIVHKLRFQLLQRGVPKLVNLVSNGKVANHLDKANGLSAEVYLGCTTLYVLVCTGA